MRAEISKVKELFLAVLEMPAAERAAYLDTACAGDAALRQQIEAMLQSHENSGELLPRSPAQMLQGGTTDADATSAFAPPGDPSATQINAPQHESDELSFLAPSAKPGQLGRLGPYEVQKVLGKGGFGVVLKAFDERLHRVVAIKVLSPAYAAIGTARKRFIREAQAAAAVKNEHVVGIHDVDANANPPYLVMEYIEGVSLQDKIDKDGTIGVKELLRIGMQMAEGLAAAHKQGLVHRDIKPANILLENGVERVKITDFGLARAVDDASVTQSGTVAGTPMYMSPEQAEGLPVDHRSDLFSLGTVLYAMCTGHPPFRASGTHAVLKRVIDAAPRPIREINGEIPDWLCDTIAKLHAKKPEERIQTAKEVAELLGQNLSELQAGRAVGRKPPVEALTESIALKPVNPAAARRRRWALPAAIIGMTAALLLVGFATNFFGLAPWGANQVAKNDIGADGQPPFVPVFGGPGWRPLNLGGPNWNAHGEGNSVEGGGSLTSGSTETKERMPKNFHLRMEVKLWRGKGTLRFHALPLVQRFDVVPPRDGWFVNFTESSAKPGMVDCQMLSLAPPGKLVGPPDGPPETPVVVGVAKIEEWFYLEIIAHAQSADVLVNGKKVMTLTNPDFPPTEGIISLWNNGRKEAVIEKRKGSLIAFRHLEIKELLPPEEPGWVQLFNGKDLTGWKEIGDNRVVDGECTLFPGAAVDTLERMPPNFHLRMEVKLMAGEGTIRFRAPPRADPPNPPFPKDGNFLKLYESGDRAHLGFFPAGGIDGGEADFGKWVKLEILAKDDWVTLTRGIRSTTLSVPTFVQGKAVKSGKSRAGVISLGNSGRGNSRFLFRKIEIKELPASKTPRPALPFVLVWPDRKSVVVDTALGRVKIAVHVDKAPVTIQGLLETAFKKIEINVVPTEEPDWVQLFNGKDLAGWKTLPETPGRWKVIAGNLTCFGPTSYLFTERDDFKDFHFRVEARINEGGDSGQFFRCQFGPNRRDGFEAQISSNPGYKANTGSLSIHVAADVSELANLKQMLVPPDTWFTQEVVANGNHIQIFVNGKKVVDLVADEKSPRQGRLALQHWQPETHVEFRKIEIKELPPGPPADDRAKLQGEWIGKKYEVKGKVFPGVGNFSFTFTGDRARLKTTADSDPFKIIQDLEGVLLLDPNANPKRIRVIAPDTAKNVKQFIGIYDWQGDDLRICYQLYETAPAEPEYPTAFATDPKSPYKILVLRRASHNP